MATRRYKAMSEAEKKKMSNDAVMDYMTGTEGVDAVAKRYPVTGASISAWVHDFCLRKNPALYQRLKGKDDFTVRYLRENAGGFLYPVKVEALAEDAPVYKAADDGHKYQMLAKRIAKLEAEVMRLKIIPEPEAVEIADEPKKENWFTRLIYAF